MRCVKLQFQGFKRLLDTSTNVDDRIVAFVGPNEAGKTSILQALTWMESSSDELPATLASRGDDVQKRNGTDRIVSAMFRLETADVKAIEQLGYEHPRSMPTYVEFRQRDGSYLHELVPKLRRDSGAFRGALTLLSRAPRRLEEALAQGGEVNGSDLRDAHSQVRGVLTAPDEATSKDAATLRSFGDWIKTNDVLEHTRSLHQCADMLLELATRLEAEHPNAQALGILGSRCPKFREFRLSDRDLPNEFDINAGEEAMPVAMHRLLSVAGTNYAELLAIWGDAGRLEDRIKTANDTLRNVLGKSWTQEDLTIRLKTELNFLKFQVVVVEGGKTYHSTFGERSEGLKAFIALVLFLLSFSDEIPPILLIDEAEVHLHLNAQADLVDVLQDKIRATQTFYTTHSPGCLPHDLGRGLRFVEPTPEHYSTTISHNFWDSKHPGFSAVLFKMGAGAFAFNALRKAVLAEGAGDMILLPSLIRAAILHDTLPYQIAPRVDDFDETIISRDEIAAKVAYLVDGDKGGDDHAKHLLRIGTRPELLVRHPRGFASEDYLRPELVLSAVESVWKEGGGTDSPQRIGDLPDGETLGQRIERWFRQRDLGKGPGKVAVATRLASQFEAHHLKPGAKASLVDLHVRIESALAQRSA